MYQNYITGQTALTLNLDFSIPNNHLATVISWFVDSIPEDVLLGDTAETGRPAYHPAMMLKILLFCLFQKSIFRPKDRINVGRKPAHDGIGRTSKDFLPYHQ